MIVLVAGGELLLPGWIHKFRAASIEYWQYTGGGKSILDVELTPFWGRLASAALVILLAYFMWKLRHAPLASGDFCWMLALVMATTLAVIPMFAPYNQLILLPGLMAVAHTIRPLWRAGRVSRFLVTMSAVSVLWPWLAAAGLVVSLLLLPGTVVQRAWALPLYSNFAIPMADFGIAPGRRKNHASRVDEPTAYLAGERGSRVVCSSSRYRYNKRSQRRWGRRRRAERPSMALTAISHHSSGSGVFPALVFVQGNEQKNIVLNRTPFTVGRKVDKDLVIADPRVSRDHAQIMQEGQEFFLVDLGSKHGTFVNGERIQRQKLERGDRLEFGARDSAYILFNPAQRTSNTAREFLSQISGIQIKQEATDLEKLTLFLEAARKLNTAGVLDEILMTMLDVTLQLTRAERAYVFLKDEEGKLRLAAGRNSKKEPLLDDKTISHSILEESMRSNSEFLVTDTSQSLDLGGSPEHCGLRSAELSSASRCARCLCSRPVTHKLPCPPRLPPRRWEFFTSTRASPRAISPA